MQHIFMTRFVAHQCPLLDAVECKFWLRNDFHVSNDFRLLSQVMDAEKQKADSGADHQEKTLVFHAAESKVSWRRNCVMNIRLIIALLSGTIFRTKVQVEHRKIASLFWGEADLPGPAQHAKRAHPTASKAPAIVQVQVCNISEESWVDQRIDSQKTRRFVWSTAGRCQGAWSRCWKPRDCGGTAELRVQLGWNRVGVTDPFEIGESVEAFGSEREGSGSSQDEGEEPRSASNRGWRWQARRTRIVGVRVERHSWQVGSLDAPARKAPELMPRAGQPASIARSHPRTKTH